MQLIVVEIFCLFFLICVLFFLCNLQLLLFNSYVWFPRMCTHCDCSIHMIATTNSLCINTKAWHHKYTVCAAWLPCCTYSATRVTKFTPVCEEKKNPVTFGKTIFVRKLSHMRTGLIVCHKEGRQSVVKPVFLLLTDPSFLSPSFCAFYQFLYTCSITHWRLWDSLRMNEEDHLNHSLRRWTVTDHTFIQFYDSEWKSVIN